MANREITTKYILQGDAGGLVAAGERARSSFDGIVGASRRAEEAISSLSVQGKASVDRLQNSFDNLKIKSNFNIDAERQRIVSSFDMIRNSGVVSSAEVSRAHAAMRQRLAELDGGAVNTAGRFDMLSGTFSRFGGIVAGVGIAAVVQELLSAGMAAERFRNSFEAATGSVQKGKAEYGFARSEAQRLGLDLQSTADAYLKLTASSKGTALEGEKTRQIFSAVAGASRAMGLGADQQSGALLAISQMMSKGTVQAEELRGQLGERLPGAFNIAAKAMGVTTAELGKMLEGGQVIAADFLPKFAAELEKTFPPGEKAMSGLTAETMRLKTAWFELKTTVMDSGGEGMFAGAIRGMKSLTEEAGVFVRTLSKTGSLIPYLTLIGGSTAAGAAYGTVATPGLGTAVGGVLGFGAGVAGTFAVANSTGALDKYGRPPVPLNKFESDLAAPNFGDRFNWMTDSVLSPRNPYAGQMRFRPEVSEDFGSRLIRDNAMTKEEIKHQETLKANSAKLADLALMEENAYTKLYNTLQDKRSEHNPMLSKEQQEMLKLRDEYDKHIAAFPKYRAELERNFMLDFEQLSIRQKLTRETKSLTASIKELETETKDADVLSLAPARFGMLANRAGEALTTGNRYGKADFYYKPDNYGLLSADPSKEPTNRAQFAAADRLPSNATNFSIIPSEKTKATRTPFSLLGPGPSTIPNGFDREKERLEEEKHKAELLKIEERFNQNMMATKMSMAEQSLSLLQQTSKQGSGIAIAALLAQKGLAVTQIMINTNAAASAALLPPPVGLGPIAGQGMYAEIMALGYANAALTGAIGIMQVTNEIAGKRERGGPTSPRSWYEVNEAGVEMYSSGGRDYLLTGGSSGYVTPADKVGGTTVVINQSFNITGVGADLTANMRTIANQAGEKAKAEILTSMNRGGTFAKASGRA